MLKMKICSTAIIAILLAATSPVRALAGDIWQISQMDGGAQVVVPGVAPVSLTQGDVLAPGQKIVTGSDGRVVLIRGEEKIIVSPNSSMGLPAGKEGKFTTRILHSLGTLLFEVGKKKTAHFEVVTPYMAAVVKGTMFTTSVDVSGAAVHVLSGLVEVSDRRGGRAALVRPGQTATLAVSGNGLRINGRRVEPSAPATTESDGTSGEESGGDFAAAADGLETAITAVESQSDVSKAEKSSVRNAKAIEVAVDSTAKNNGITIARDILTSEIDVPAVTGGLLRAADVGSAKATGGNSRSGNNASQNTGQTGGGNTAISSAGAASGPGKSSGAKSGGKSSAKSGGGGKPGGSAGSAKAPKSTPAAASAPKAAPAAASAPKAPKAAPAVAKAPKAPTIAAKAPKAPTIAAKAPTVALLAPGNSGAGKAKGGKGKGGGKK